MYILSYWNHNHHSSCDSRCWEKQNERERGWGGLFWAFILTPLLCHAKAIWEGRSTGPSPATYWIKVSTAQMLSHLNDKNKLYSPRQTTGPYRGCHQNTTWFSHVLIGPIIAGLIVAPKPSVSLSYSYDPQ